jgi:hypothetical protein
MHSAYGNHCPLAILIRVRVSKTLSHGGRAASKFSSGTNTEQNTRYMGQSKAGSLHLGRETSSLDLPTMSIGSISAAAQGPAEDLDWKFADVSWELSNHGVTKSSYGHTRKINVQGCGRGAGGGGARGKAMAATS